MRWIILFLVLTPLTAAAQKSRLAPLVGGQPPRQGAFLDLAIRPGAGTTIWSPVASARSYTTALAWDASRGLLWQVNESAEGPNLLGLTTDGKYTVVTSLITAGAVVPSNPKYPVSSGLGSGIACMPDPTGSRRPRWLMITDYNGDLSRVDDNAFVWDPDLGKGPYNVRAYYVLDDTGPCVQGSRVVPCMPSTNGNQPRRRINGVTGIAALNSRHDRPGNIFLVASYLPRAAPPIHVVEFTDGAPGLWRIQATLVNPIGSSVGGIDFDAVNQRFWFCGLEDGMVYEVAFDTQTQHLIVEQAFPSPGKKINGLSSHGDRAWPHVLSLNLPSSNRDQVVGVDSGNEGSPLFTQEAMDLIVDASEACAGYNYVLLFSFTASGPGIALDAERTLGHDFDFLFILSVAGLLQNTGTLDQEGKVRYSMPGLPPRTKIPVSILVLDPVASRSTYGIKLTSPVFTYKA